MAKSGSSSATPCSVSWGSWCDFYSRKGHQCGSYGPHADHVCSCGQSK